MPSNVHFEDCNHMPVRNVYYLLIALCVSIFISSKTSIRYQIARNVSHIIQKRSLAAPSEKTIFEGALKGMLDSVDDQPYTAYLPPSDQPEYMREIYGQYAGIGVTMLLKDDETGEFYFIPTRNSPAMKAGLKFGDRIVKVDDKHVSEMSIFDLSDSLRGEENTNVKVTLRPRASALATSDEKNTDDELTDVVITRALIQQDVVLGDRFQSDESWIFTLKNHPDIGYIAIEQFVDTTGMQTKAALDELEKQGVTKVILDFRGNPGGFLPAAVAICNEFLAYGSPIVETRDMNGSVRRYSAEKNTKRRFKVVALVDGGSASASEIVSAALQDAGAAVVVGTRSYGKGTVQSIIELPFNSGVLHMTTASFWRPSGRPIHRARDASPDDEWGVHPDPGYEVPVSPLQSFYMKWVRRVRVSGKDAEALDARALSFMTTQMQELERLLLDGTPVEKAEVASELGLTFSDLLPTPEDAEDSADENLSDEQNDANQKNENVEEEVDNVPSSSTSAESSSLRVEPSEFKPQGRAPYFDPQLDRAVDYLLNSNES